MGMSALFEPIHVGKLDLSNRIVVAPMCQYSAEKGCMNDWHLIHLGHLSISGAALLTIEATAVLPEGRITWADVGLWNDETEAAMGRTLESIRRWSDITIGVQLNHAGRKASVEVPWDGGKQFAPNQPHGWQTVAPSPVRHAEGDVPPLALDRDGLRRVREAFVASAARAARLGIELIQLHCGHGYLLHQFFSPITNRRDDEYGGSLESRMRYPLEVFEAVLRGKSVSVRVSTEVGISSRLALLRRCWRSAVAMPFTSRAAGSTSPSKYRWGQAIRCRSREPSSPSFECR